MFCWKPRTRAAAMSEPRYGSSPEPSAIRPQRGSRAMSTIGAYVQLIPKAAASWPAARGVGIERTRFAERDREDRAIAVDHVEAKEQRDLEAGLGDGDALHRRRVLGAHDVEQPAQFARAHEIHLLWRGAPVGRQQIQLAQLFFEGHAGEERVEVLGRSWCGEEDRENQNVADTRHRIALSGPGKVQQSYGPKRDMRSPSAGRDCLGKLLALTRFHRRWSMSRHRFLWLACIALLASPLSLSAQTTTGTVRGYVKDQNGTPVADAEVQARQVETGIVRSTTGHADGSYILPGLTPGNYDLSVRKIGFGPQRRQVVVQIGATTPADFTVQAGAVELQAVTVEAAPVVELRTSEVATNVTPQQIQQLPTSSRNFLDLAALAPGVTVAEDRVNSIGFRTFSAGGSTPNQVNVFVDGTSLKNDLTGGGVAGQDASRGNPFPRNAIQEYRVISQNFKAEYQKASSAVISATTRSGGNTWTGNAFFGYQNKGLVALDTFQLAQQRTNPNFTKPDFTRSLVGVSAGGPIQ